MRNGKKYMKANINKISKNILIIHNNTISK